MRSIRGFSSIELLIVFALTSVVFLGAVGIFREIGYGFFLSKTKGLAVVVAREKLESVKRQSVATTLVSYSSTTVPGSTTAFYDPINYPEETIISQGKTYRRYTMVERM